MGPSLRRAGQDWICRRGTRFGDRHGIARHFPASPKMSGLSSAPGPEPRSTSTGRGRAGRAVEFIVEKIVSAGRVTGRRGGRRQPIQRRVPSGHGSRSWWSGHRGSQHTDTRHQHQTATIQLSHSSNETMCCRDCAAGPGAAPQVKPVAAGQRPSHSWRVTSSRHCRNLSDCVFCAATHHPYSWTCAGSAGYLSLPVLYAWRFEWVILRSRR